MDELYTPPIALAFLVAAALFILALRGLSSRPRFVTTAHGLNSPGWYSSIMARGERVICVSNICREPFCGMATEPNPKGMEQNMLMPHTVASQEPSHRAAVAL